MKHGTLPIATDRMPAMEARMFTTAQLRSAVLERSRRDGQTRRSIGNRSAPPVSAAPHTPAGLDALLAHLLASRFAHMFVNRLLRSRFAMTLSRGVCVRLVFLRRLANGHSILPEISISRVPRARQHNLITCGFASR